MTRIVSCAADATGLDFLVADDLLPADACDRLVKAYHANSGLYDRSAADPHWRDRVLFYQDLRQVDAAVADLVLGAMTEAVSLVAKFYDLAAPLYPDVLSLVGWPVGKGIWPPHADAEREDGQPHEFAYRAYSGVLYLNDGFEGGGLYLPRQDILIQPRPGMFVSLPAWMSHQHGVIPVTSGLRIAATFFLTFDPARADRQLTPALTEA